MRAVHALAFLMLIAAPIVATADEEEMSAAPAAVVGNSFGEAVPSEALEAQRGGDEDVVTNVIRVTGDVSGNSATEVATGANTIREGSFADASGLTTVVQNTGANVLIQSATIVNIQFVDP